MITWKIDNVIVEIGQSFLIHNREKYNSPAGFYQTNEFHLYMEETTAIYKVYNVTDKEITLERLLNESRNYFLPRELKINKRNYTKFLMIPYEKTTNL